jgi:hypothetical protein
MAIKTAAWIENSGEIVRTGIVHVACEGGKPWRTRVKEEVAKPAFHGEKGMKAVMAEFELGAKEAVKGTHVGACASGRWRNRRVVREAPVKTGLLIPSG